MEVSDLCPLFELREGKKESQPKYSSKTLAYKDVEFYHLLPVLGHNQNFSSFSDGALKATQEIMNIFVITMIIPFMKNPQKNMKGAI
jgi:hypothetical protein